MYSVMLLPMADGNSGICFKHCLLEIIDICPAKCGEDGPWLPCGLYIWFCFHVFFSKPSNVVAPFDMGLTLHLQGLSQNIHEVGFRGGNIVLFWRPECM